MILIWIGALLVVAGVVFTAAQALWRGRLSDAKPSRSGVASDTLEPQGRSSGFSLKANWPGLAMIAFGSVLLLVGAAL
jgi:hypothetical protein